MVLSLSWYVCICIVESGKLIHLVAYKIYLHAKDEMYPCFSCFLFFIIATAACNGRGWGVTEKC